MKPGHWLLLTGLGTTPPERGVSDYAGEFSSAPVLSWRVSLPGPTVPSASHTELGAPLIHGDHIYLGSAGADVLYVLDRRSGRLVGSYDAGGTVQSRPIIEDGLLYFADTSGKTWCYPLGADEPTWTHTSGSPILSTPTLDGDQLYIANVENVVYALDRATGELEWRYAHRIDATRSAELELYGAPSPARAGDLLLTGFSDGRVVALDVYSGEQRWQRTVGEGTYPDLIASPLVDGDAAVVAGFSEPLVRVELENRAIRWRLDVGGPQAALVIPAPEPTEADPDPEPELLHGGVDGKLRRIGMRSGDVAWEWDSGTATSLTRPTLTEAGVLVGASGGSFYLVDDETGDRIWAWQPNFHPSGITSEPAVDGRQAVVVTNAGFVMSFVSPADEPTWERWTPDGQDL